MIDYCYEGWKSPEMDILAVDLLGLGHRYNMTDLMDDAVSVLRAKITLDTWCTIVSAADACGCVSLSNLCSFILTATIN
jgi:hypothetical protein